MIFLKLHSEIDERTILSVNLGWFGLIQADMVSKLHSKINYPLILSVIAATIRKFKPKFTDKNEGHHENYM